MTDQDFDLTQADYTTRAVHTGQDKQTWDSLPVAAPIVMTSNFIMDIDKIHQDYVYTRTSNPTRDVFETCLASLEGAKYALATSSGMSALSVLLSTVMRSGDHLIYGDDMYGGSSGLIKKMCDRFGLNSTIADTVDLSNVENAIQKNTKLIFIETPTNPMLKVTDLRKLSALAKKHKVLVAVDNTFLTSYFQRPLELGVDIVHYSLSKYVSGHSDIIMGALITNNEEIYKQMKSMANSMGVAPSPFNCFLTNRSLKTLPLRMDRHMKSAMTVAKFLESHPAITKVIYTGLTSHPQYELSKSQTYGHNGMITFYIKGGADEIKVFIKSLKMVLYAGSLGGPQTAVQIPTLISHEYVPEEEKKKLGITDNLVRLTIGLESSDDIIKDLDQALRKATKL